MKTYSGRRNASGVEVLVNGQPLSPRRDLWNHSPTGFDWGYSGNASAQLALAILADCLEDVDAAVRWHHEFKSTVIARLPHDSWSMTEVQIRESMLSLASQRQPPSHSDAVRVAIAKFRLGRIVTTLNALQRLPQEDILLGVQRHQCGDWGDVDEHDRQENEASLQQSLRLMSVYHARDGTRFWLITEADRSVTTVLLPEDY
jgi:hypothetical protein